MKSRLPCLQTGLLLVCLGVTDVWAGVSVVSPNYGVETDGVVRRVTVDTNGFFYIAGGFDSVNGVYCPNAARFTPDGVFDEQWRPMPNDQIFKALPVADGVYLAGIFEHLGATQWYGLAKVDKTTGALMPEFNPQLSDPQVADVLQQGNNLYVAGAFTNAGGADRVCIAKLNAASGAADASFTNGPTFGQVASIALDETGLYAGGVFFDIGGEQRMYLAKLSSASGDPAPDAFTNGADNMLTFVDATGGYVYTCGYFDEIEGVSHPSFARLDRATGAVDTNFASGIVDPYDGAVQVCAVAGDAVFVGGDFTNYAGTARSGIAKVRVNDGAVIGAFTGQVDGTVLGLAPFADGRLLVGGIFTNVNNRRHYSLAMLDAATGANDTNFTPRLAYCGVVYAALPLSDGGWVLGGDFKFVNGAPIANLTKLDANGVVDAGWLPQPDGSVNALATDGTYLYVGGGFENIGGHTLASLAKISLATGAVDTNFSNAGIVGSVYTMIFTNNVLYVGGSFTAGAQTNLVKVNANTGLPVPGFSASANYYVTDMAVDDSLLYICGNFTNVNGADCRRVARLSAVSGTVDTAWSSNAQAAVRISSIAVMPNAVFIGGDGILRKLEKNTGLTDTNWVATCNGYVFAMAADENYLYAGGNFEEINGGLFNNAVRLDINTGAADTNWVPNPNGAIDGIFLHAPCASLWGGFSLVADEFREGFATLAHARPQVEITAPEPPDAWFQSVATIPCSVSVVAEAGLAITQVVYCADGVPVAVEKNAPYDVILAPVPEGQYVLTAVAYDQYGISGTSAPVNVSVTPLPVAADFDGDGKADPALQVIPADAIAPSWFVWLSGSGYGRRGPVLPGEIGATPLAGDVDGDGKADPVLWWEDDVQGCACNAWKAWLSGSGYAPVGPIYLGAVGLAPILADFDGDGKADPGINNDDRTYNVWRVWRSRYNYADTGNVRLGAFVEGTPLAADFDGDHLADLGKFYENNWWVWMSNIGYQLRGPYLLDAPEGGLALAADFDGDGRADPALYVPQGNGYSSGWYVWLSSASYQRRGPYALFAP